MTKPTPYCEDCEHIIPLLTSDEIEALRGARCKASPCDTPETRISRKFKQQYEFCTTVRQNKGACPKSEAKDDKD